MSDPTPEQPPRPAEGEAWPGGGFGAPPGVSAPGRPTGDGGGPSGGPPANPWSAPTSYGAPGQPPPPPGYPAQPAYPNQAAYPPPQGLQGYPSAYPAPMTYAAPGATTSSVPGSTLVLLIVSVVGIVATGIIGIPSAIIAAVAWRRNGTDPTAARKRTTTGWIVLAVNFAVGILALIPFYVWVSNNR